MSKHTPKQTCTKWVATTDAVPGHVCGKPSIPGLIHGAGKCQFHWSEGVWGTAWAKEVEARAAIKQAEENT